MSEAAPLPELPNAAPLSSHPGNAPPATPSFSAQLQQSFTATRECESNAGAVVQQTLHFLSSQRGVDPPSGSRALGSRGTPLVVAAEAARLRDLCRTASSQMRAMSVASDGSGGPGKEASLPPLVLLVDFLPEELRPRLNRRRESGATATSGGSISQSIGSPLTVKKGSATAVSFPASQRCPSDVIMAVLLFLEYFTIQRSLVLCILALTDLLDSDPNAALDVALTLALHQLWDIRGSRGVITAGSGPADTTTGPLDVAVQLPAHLVDLLRRRISSPPQAAVYTEAQQLSKEIFKLEAAVISYVEAVLSRPPLPDAPGGSVPLVDGEDILFLRHVVQRFDIFHGACNDVTFLWMTVAARTGTLTASQDTIIRRARRAAAALETVAALRDRGVAAAVLLTVEALQPGVKLILGEVDGQLQPSATPAAVAATVPNMRPPPAPRQLAENSLLSAVSPALRRTSLPLPPIAAPFASTAPAATQRSSISVSAATLSSSAQMPPPPRLRGLLTTPTVTLPATPPTALPPLPPPPPSSSSMAPKLSSVRRCHRLRQPQDALVLGGPIPDAVITTAADVAAAAAAAVEAANAAKEKRRLKRRQRSTDRWLMGASLTILSGSMSSANPRDRSFLPGDIQRRKEKEERRKSRAEQKQLQQDQQQAAAAQSSGSVAPAKRSKRKSKGEAGAATQSNSGIFTAATAITAAAGSVTGEAPQQQSGQTNDAADPLSIQPETPSASWVPPRSTPSGNNSIFNSGTNIFKVEGEEAEEEGRDANDDSSFSTSSDEEEHEEETLEEKTTRYRREILSYFSYMHHMRHRAAIAVQCAWRCAQARQALKERQQKLYGYVHVIQQAAALCIQGFLQAFILNKARVRRLAQNETASVQRAAEERRRLLAAQVLSRAVRRWLDGKRQYDALRSALNVKRDERLRLYEKAAIQVQRWWPVARQRKAYWRRRAMEVEAERRHREAAEQLDRAATKIQCHVRGVLGRKMATQYRRQRMEEQKEDQRRRSQGATVIATALREYATRLERVAKAEAVAVVRREEAARIISSGWRHAIQRRLFADALQRAMTMRKAAQSIQWAWRCFVAGRQRRYLRQLRYTLAEERLAWEIVEYRATLRLQAFARMIITRAAVRRLRATRGRLWYQILEALQSAGRGALARRQLAALRAERAAMERAEAAAAEQRRQKAAVLTQVSLRWQQSCQLTQALHRSVLAERIVVRKAAYRQLREEAAAVVIERAVRRWLRRRRVAALEAEMAEAFVQISVAVVLIQTAWRGFLARQERRLRAMAADEAARKRIKMEEVMQLIWKDQVEELELTLILERQYIAEDEYYRRGRIRDAYTKSFYAALGRGQKLQIRDAGANEEAAAPMPLSSTASSVDEATEWAGLYDDSGEEGMRNSSSIR